METMQNMMMHCRRAFYNPLPHLFPSVQDAAFTHVKALNASSNEAFYALCLSLYCLAMWVVAISFLLAVEAEAASAKETATAAELEANMLDHNATEGSAMKHAGAERKPKQVVSEKKQRLLLGSARAAHWAAQRKGKKMQQLSGQASTHFGYQGCLQDLVLFGTKAMRRIDTHGVFLLPVTDNIAPGYSNVIKDPICISIIERKAAEMEYKHLSEFERDVRLMFHNCIVFNNTREGKWFQDEAKRQKRAWEQKIMPQVQDLKYKKDFSDCRGGGGQREKNGVERL